MVKEYIAPPQAGSAPRKQSIDLWHEWVRTKSERQPWASRVVDKAKSDWTFDGTNRNAAETDLRTVP